MSDFWTERIETPATVDDWHVFLMVHRSEESFWRDSIGMERTFLTQRRGCKAYVMAKSCILSPRITLTAAIYPEPKGKEIGQVVGSEWEGMDKVEIGRAQAWHYHDDRVLVLWECYLFEPWRESEKPAEDERHTQVWQTFEDALVQWFNPQLIVTPGWEPVYQQGDWQAFLKQAGYQLEGNAGVKRLEDIDGSDE